MKFPHLCLVYSNKDSNFYSNEDFNVDSNEGSNFYSDEDFDFYIIIYWFKRVCDWSIVFGCSDEEMRDLLFLEEKSDLVIFRSKGTLTLAYFAAISPIKLKESQSIY